MGLNTEAAGLDLQALHKKGLKRK